MLSNILYTLLRENFFDVLGRRLAGIILLPEFARLRLDLTALLLRRAIFPELLTLLLVSFCFERGYSGNLGAIAEPLPPDKVLLEVFWFGSAIAVSPEKMSVLRISSCRILRLDSCRNCEY